MICFLQTNFPSAGSSVPALVEVRVGNKIDAVHFKHRTARVKWRVGILWRIYGSIQGNPENDWGRVRGTRVCYTFERPMRSTTWNSMASLLRSPTLYIDTALGIHGNIPRAGRDYDAQNGPVSPFNQHLAIRICLYYRYCYNSTYMRGGCK